MICRSPSLQTSALLVLLTPAFCPGVLGATFTANPALDAFLATGPSGNLSNNNYGSGGVISVAAPGSTQGEFKSVLQFNLAPAATAFNSEFGAGNWAIQSVSLQLTAGAGGNAIFNAPQAGLFSVSWQLADGWVEGTGNPNNAGATGITFTSLHSTFIGAGDEAVGTFSFAGGTSGSANYGLSLTPGFLNDLAAGGAVSLRLAAADSGVSAVFNSRSFGTVANRPVLTVQAAVVPEPGAVGLAGLGLAALAARHFRRAGKK